MKENGKQLHVTGSTGVTLTRFWEGHYTRDFQPLTSVIVAVRVEKGILLVQPPSRREWALPGGAREPKELSVACARRRLMYETGFSPMGLSVAAYFRLLVGSRIEHGALVFCRINECRCDPRKSSRAMTRVWDGKAPIAGLEPISATIATLAMKTHAWRLA